MGDGGRNERGRGQPIADDGSFSLLEAVQKDLVILTVGLGIRRFTGEKPVSTYFSDRADPSEVADGKCFFFERFGLVESEPLRGPSLGRLLNWNAVPELGANYLPIGEI